MSTTFFRIIPQDYSLRPPSASQLDMAVKTLKSYVGKSRSTEAIIYEEVSFVDQGEGFENVFCPECRKELDTDWWQDAMDNAYEQKFENLECTCPHCRKGISLNDLDYHSPAGFARFILQVDNPEMTEDLEADKIKALEAILHCTLRQLWAHY